MTTVDIYNDPGITLNANAALQIAAQHEVHDLVLSLLPHTVFGPGYNRGIHDYLRTSLRMFRDGRAEEGRHWLRETQRWAKRQGVLDA